MGEPESSAQLVARARTGEAKAFEELVRRHLRAAYAVALAILGRPADAEDVAQDSFIAAFERLDTCRDAERFAGWLLQIVRNRARNALESRRLRTADGASDAQQLPADVPLRARLLQALSVLTEPQREVVLLHDLEGWTHPEIGAALGISEVMSRQHLFVARRTMREQLQGEESGHG